MPTESTEEVKPTESEIMKVQREHYEKLLADKDKIIKDLIEGNKKKKKAKPIFEDEDDADADEDDADAKEEKKVDEAEERRKKRFEYYKKHIY